MDRRRPGLGVRSRDRRRTDAVERVAVPDVPIPYARPMEDEVIPDAGDIEERVRAVLSAE
ncbi:hypothetical protein DJ82_08510 [Halorubrum sp. Ib24]|nr:hypothetical protein DJ82_08510 [Halorubrum sp. Ib24]OYR47598.1 hypothetical protein DJ81_00780 [Halorubrum sp. Hd13]